MRLIKMIGGLGNQMFIAAAARTFAARTGREFIGLVKTDIARDYPQKQMETVMPVNTRSRP